MIQKLITIDNDYIVEFSKKPSLFNTDYKYIVTIVFKNSLGLEIKKINMTDIDIIKLIDNLEFYISSNCTDINIFTQGYNGLDYILNIYQDINEYGLKTYFRLIEVEYNKEILIPIIKFRVDENTYTKLMNILILF